MAPSRRNEKPVAVTPPAQAPTPVAEIVAEEETQALGRVEVSKPTPWTPSKRGWIARRVVTALLALIVIGSPALVGNIENLRAISLAMIYVIVGLSINILMGYAGQISLGHQAFVGVGAFTAALVVTKASAPFFVALLLAGVIGAISAFLLGIVALRLKGLYLALITLAYGAVAEFTIFATPAITGGGAGVNAVRPSFLVSERSFVYFSMLMVAVALYIDWRLVRSKVGRAIFAIRENELAAASFGINVTSYKLVAFVISGIFAGVAGALFGFRVESVDAANFDFALGLTFVLMAVVGGLGSRIGVFIGSAFFALLDLLIHSLFGTGFGHWLVDKVPFLGQLELYPGFIGAVLLLMTLTLYPGGIAQQIKPLTGWLGGKRLKDHGHGVTIREGGAGVRP
ncbi:MAG TPA: branched-chain amino acid ABC transporter permease [Actinomycetota bacterium]|nr:branched-chain amino acid ABC transporter permease [Actinomycetota bacterium]